MPLYLVTTGDGETKKERLVEANNPAAARNFVVKDSVKAEIVDPKKLHELAKAGVEIESAVGVDGEPEVAPEKSKQTDDDDK